MNKPPASVSLDLDNLWSYLKTHGDAGWQSFPSYFDTLAPHVLDWLARNKLRITFFVVGQDAALARNREALRRIADAGHEIGNHSFHHEPWLHLRPRAELNAELARAEEAIETATSARTSVFRGPGYSCSNVLLDVLQRRGYRCDASTLPTWMGPLARRYYFMRASLTPEERRERARLFGTFGDGLRPIRPYHWTMPAGKLLEIPVTTMPLCRVPFHVSYVLYLSTYSPRLARTYFRTALALCRCAGVEPSLLLHPLDFLGGDEISELRFFPAMNLPGALKRERVARYIGDLARQFEIVDMGTHAERLEQRGNLRSRRPNLPATTGWKKAGGGRQCVDAG